MNQRRDNIVDLFARMTRYFFVALCGSLLLRPAAIDAQQTSSSTADTSRAVPLETVVVTATRSAAAIETSTSAVTRLTGEELRRLPLRTVADALALVPGLAFLDFNGSGYDPQLTVRGFYGGGEAEYAVVLLNGVPVNRLETGRIDWDLIPVSSIDAIEVVRGSSSALYGDAAVGAVINIITRQPTRDRETLSLMGGQLGEFHAAADLSKRVGGRSVTSFGRLHRSNGFRDHAERRATTLGGSIGLVEDAGRSLLLSVLSDWRSTEDPGPLATADLARSRAQASPFYRFDESEGRLHRLAIDGSSILGSRSRLSGYLAGEYDRTDAVRTLQLAPDFADTKGRDVRAALLRGSLQLQHDREATRWGSRFVVGTDFSLGRLSTDYSDFLSGDSAGYRVATVTPGDVVASSEGVRSAAAGFAHLELRPVDVLRFSIGSRLDWLHDSFEPGEERLEATHVAFSPKAGVNLQYVRSAGHTGHLFASAGRAFKAPTPNQLFDPRPIPIPVEPYSATISNALLDPQYGNNVEAGLYHQIDRLPGDLTGRLSVAAYQTDMRDELDFDFQTFRYVNLARSRHRGVETELTLRHSTGLAAFASFTAQAVTSRSGDNEGRYLKAVPRRHLTTGINASHRSGFAGSLTANRVWGIFLDDANAVELPAYSQVDLRLSQRVRNLSVALEIFNAFDREYSPTGFPDPAGSDLLYYYPASGRRVRVGVTVGK